MPTVGGKTGLPPTCMINKDNTDDKLLEKVRLYSNQGAYCAIYRKYYPTLTAFAEMYVSAEEAEDIVQDQFLRLWTSRETLNPVMSLNSYLFICVRNACLDRIRHFQVRNRNVTELWKSLAEEATDYGCFQINEIQKLITQVLDEMPYPQRRAFEMSRFEGRTYRDIANLMGVSEKTVEYRISKVLARLQSALSDYLPSAVIAAMLMSSVLGPGTISNGPIQENKGIYMSNRLS